MKAQDLENMACMDLFDRAMSDYAQCEHSCDVSRLRSCTAWVYDTDNFYVLRSYGTFIGAIEKSTGYGADALRHEYGYTATSAQHLAKFFSDYGDRQKVYRWYN